LGHQHDQTLITTTTEEKRHKPQLPSTIALLRLSKQLKCSSVDRGAEGADTTTPGGHCRAGPNAAVLLHPNRPPDCMKNTKSGATQHAGASPLPPLDATLACAGNSNPPLSTPLSCAGTSNPPHGTTLRTRFRDCRRGSKKRCPAPPRPEPSRQTTSVVRNHHVAFPLTRRCRPRARRPKMSPAPSFDVVPHRKGSAVLNTRRDPLQAKSSLIVVAASAVLQTLSRTALETATQLQAPRNAASKRTTTE